jgi:hypothetical protein
MDQPTRICRTCGKDTARERRVPDKRLAGTSTHIVRICVNPRCDTNTGQASLADRV